MKNHHVEKPDLSKPVVLTDADVEGVNKCDIEYVDCIEDEHGSLICKTIKNNCLDETMHKKASE